MQLCFDIMRWLHIVSGFLALCVLWVPIVTKKGGRTHHRVGWLYVIAMGMVSLTAFFMGIYRIAWDAGAMPSRMKHMQLAADPDLRY